MIDRRLAYILVAVVAGITVPLGACGGSTSPTATPPATLSPAPGPTPTPTAASLSCPLGKGSVDASCDRSGSRLLGDLDAAIDQVMAAHPEFFKKDPRTGRLQVPDRDGFIEGVLEILQGQGMCAGRIPQSDRIQVKESNEYSEQYELVTAAGFMSRGEASYEKTCSPAAFPLDVGDPVVRLFVGIFRFRCVNGVAPPPTNQNLVPSSCDAVITATPKDKDGKNVPSWLHSQNPEFWLRSGENDVVVMGEYPGNTFNRWIYPKGVGSFSVCAAVDGAQRCMNGLVIP